jgi:NTP pyrophosphatase (non-canonical NTP hydrolase)
MKKEEIIERLIRMAEAEPWESTKTRDALYSAVEIVAKERKRERDIEEYIAHDIWATNEAAKKYSAAVCKKNLVDSIGVPALLEQTAEECTELAQACLKYARYLRAENKVHRPLADIQANFFEELIDVMICIDELEAAGMIDHDEIERIKEYKLKRMKERMAEDLR